MSPVPVEGGAARTVLVAEVAGLALARAMLTVAALRGDDRCVVA